MNLRAKKVRKAVEYYILKGPRTVRCWYDITHGFGIWYNTVGEDEEYDFYSEDEASCSEYDEPPNNGDRRGY
ncbi:hypothetical protein P167DRAFT_580832 [Morchella conica CCBAS932]|uniref:Uncharacterized protein n=1 Tax=Morchella conica CCBAS932 TaxID=1392247 RepID=A0A3N4KCX5_9PEZI|nr:hypothetical protein P167DRAFT_580832 [Morchella conica CCBAS932]